MLDIIIPAYEDLNGLQQTLQSIGTLFDLTQVKIYIIDDCSPNISKQDYIKFLKPYFDIYGSNLIFTRLPKNYGPGYVRSYGLKISKLDYIVFIDCGDLFNGPMTIYNYLQHQQQYPTMQLFIYGLIMEEGKNNFVNVHNHELYHGTMFKRSFFIDNQLIMPLANSYAHEDIPFLTLCKIIAYNQSILLECNEQIVVIHTFNQNSITNKNNGQDYNTQFVHGYLENTLDILQQHPNLDIHIQSAYIARMMINIYILMNLSINYNEQIRNKDLVLARQFYNQYYKNCKINPNEFIKVYYYILGAYLPNIEMGYTNINIQTFFDELNNYQGE